MNTSRWYLRPPVIVAAWIIATIVVTAFTIESAYLAMLIAERAAWVSAESTETMRPGPHYAVWLPVAVLPGVLWGFIQPYVFARYAWPRRQRRPKAGAAP